MNQQEIQAQDRIVRHNGFFGSLVEEELVKARAAHGPMASEFEGYAVILEEVRELEAEVFKKEPDREKLKSELIQVATMCRRMAEDVIPCKDVFTQRSFGEVRSAHEGYAAVLYAIRNLEQIVFHKRGRPLFHCLQFVFACCQRMAEELNLLAPKIVEMFEIDGTDIQCVAERVLRERADALKIPEFAEKRSPWYIGFTAGLERQSNANNPFTQKHQRDDWDSGWDAAEAELDNAQLSPHEMGYWEGLAGRQETPNPFNQLNKRSEWFEGRHVGWTEFLAIHKKPRQPTQPRDPNPKSEGHDAGLAGAGSNDCLYASGSNHEALWMEGWELGHADYLGYAITQSSTPSLTKMHIKIIGETCKSTMLSRLSDYLKSLGCKVTCRDEGRTITPDAKINPDDVPFHVVLETVIGE